MKPADRLPLVLLALTLALLVWSVIRPFDFATWCLEVFPAVGGIVAIAITHRRFPLTPLVLVLIFLHMALLIVGGHYTYSRVPLGNWAMEAFNLERNHYDRLGHIVQGFVPAMIAREILVRNRIVARRGWLGFIIVCICTAISAVYELVEWAVAEVAEAGSVEFLGTQGDVWDTHKDMALCIVGAVAALVLLSRVHDRLMERSR